MTETISYPGLKYILFICSSTTTIAGECTPTVANATDCAIVKSSIYVTSNTGHKEQARANTLTLINHRLERGTYEQGTILHTSYLGPDLDKLSMIGSNGQVSTLNGSSSSSPSSSSHPTVFYVAIGVVSLAAMALVVFLAVAFKVHKELKRREVREVSSITGSASGRSHRSAAMAVEDLHVSYGPGSSSRNSAHFIKPQSTPEDYDRRYLLGQPVQRF